MDDRLRKQQLYYARRELGLCVRCGMPLDPSGKYVNCADCREKARLRQEDINQTEWRREYMRQYRDKTKSAMDKLAALVQTLKTPVEMDLNVKRRKIPDDHKCWGCVWSRWHGDRFFCPLVGCVKKPMKQEAADECRSEDNAD